jgi:membrane protein
MIPLFKKAMQELLKNDPLRMAAATAFFTTFALPPILVILIQVFKLVLNPAMIRGELFQSLSDMLGPEAVRQVMEVLQGFRRLAQNWYIIIAGFIFLLFVATTLFKIIKSSVNQVWKIKPVNKRGILKSLGSRVQSVFVILIAGILFMAGILAEGLQAFIGRYIFEFSPLLSFYFNSILNHLVSVFIVTVWFAIVFRYLPDGRPGWNIAFAGGFVTGLLFTIGKLILHWLLSYSNINTLYGTSASIVLLLLFVFYSSLILYYGAAFTKVWGIYKRQPIRPLPHAMHYRLAEAEMEV